MKVLWLTDLLSLFKCTWVSLVIQLMRYQTLPRRCSWWKKSTNEQLKSGKEVSPSFHSCCRSNQDIVDFREQMLHESASTTLIGKVGSRLIMLSTGPAAQQFPSAGGCAAVAQYWTVPSSDEMFLYKHLNTMAINNHFSINPPLLWQLSGTLSPQFPGISTSS